MRKLVKLSLFLVAIALIFPSCVSKKKFTELLSSKEAIDANLASTQSKVKMLEGEKEELMTAKADLESQNATLTSDLASVKAKSAAVTSELEVAKTSLSETEIKLNKAETNIKSVFSALEGSGLNVLKRDNRLYVVMDEPVTFKSGSTRVARKYRDGISAIAEIIKNNPNLHLQVEGHSDNAKFISGGGNNWTLSMNRAMSAVNLMLKDGVNPNQVSAVGRGEFAPIAGEDPDSKEARLRNRRIEFVVVPNISSIATNP